MQLTTSFLTLFLSLTSYTAAKAIDASLALDLPEGVVAYRVSPSEIPNDIKNAAHGQTDHPNAPSNLKLAKRANPNLKDPGVYMCTDAGFKGSCWYVKTQHLKCLNFPNQWNDVFSSVGPDKTQECRFYVHANCDDRGSSNPYIVAFHPGYDALHHYPGESYEYKGKQYATVENMLSSVKCSHYWQILCDMDKKNCS